MAGAVTKATWLTIPADAFRPVTTFSLCTITTTRPQARLQLLCRRQSEALRRLHGAWQRRAERDQSRLRELARSLSTISPLATVARGYSILQREDGRVVRAVGDVAAGERVEARVSDGQLKLQVL